MRRGKEKETEEGWAARREYDLLPEKEEIAALWQNEPK